jgi:hypothetical protein
MDEDTQLLSKGLKYNLRHKQKDWIQTLVIEAKTAINQLSPNEQADIRQCVTTHNTSWTHNIPMDPLLT